MNASIAGSLRQLGDLAGAELRHRHLVGIDAGFLQDDAQQDDVGLGPADDADAMAGEIVDTLDFRRRRFLRALGGSPEGAHSTTTFLRRMATDSASAGMSRSPRATARSALPAFSSAMLSAAPSVCNRREPDRTLVARKGLRQRLDQFLIVAARRADRDLQGYRPQRPIHSARRRGKQQQPGGKHQQRGDPALAAPERRRVCRGPWRPLCRHVTGKTGRRVRLSRPKRAAWLRFRARCCEAAQGRVPRSRFGPARDIPIGLRYAIRAVSPQRG